MLGINRTNPELHNLLGGEFLSSTLVGERPVLVLEVLEGTQITGLLGSAFECRHNVSVLSSLLRNANWFNTNFDQ